MTITENNLIRLKLPSIALCGKGWLEISSRNLAVDYTGPNLDLNIIVSNKTQNCTLKQKVC